MNAERNQELEVKLYLTNLDVIQEKVQNLNGELVKPRVLEKNYRFDTPDWKLTRAYQVLRLRMDTIARMTFKGPLQEREGVRVRKEIEFTVDNFDAAYEFLVSLGYQVYMIYEKYRTVYRIDKDIEISIDELPYGNFIEIEGSEPTRIHQVCDLLNLDWNRRIQESYSTLFVMLKKSRNLQFRDLTFENFASIQVSLGELGILSADWRLGD